MAGPVLVSNSAKVSFRSGAEPETNRPDPAVTLDYLQRFTDLIGKELPQGVIEKVVDTVCRTDLFDEMFFVDANAPLTQ